MLQRRGWGLGGTVLAVAAAACAPATGHEARQDGTAACSEASALDEDPLQFTLDGVLQADLFRDPHLGADVAVQNGVAVVGAPGDGDHGVVSVWRLRKRGSSAA